MAMDIKCSLFGHAYGETTVEREREEQGSEVVITIRELETCTRCGETRVVSENKEVTTVETPEDIDIDGEREDDEASAAGGSVPPTDASSGAEIVDAEAGQPVESSAENDSAGEEPTPPQPADENEVNEAPKAAEDDGVILNEEADEPGREPGEWPDETDADAAEEDRPPIPDLEPDDERIDESRAGDAEPQSSEAAGRSASESGADGTGGGAVTVPEGAFRCSECGFSTPVDASSLREGDYCPECHRGTLVIETE